MTQTRSDQGESVFSNMTQEEVDKMTGNTTFNDDGSTKTAPVKTGEAREIAVNLTTGHIHENTDGHWPGDEYTHFVEYSALESARREIERLKNVIEGRDDDLDYEKGQLTEARAQLTEQADKITDIIGKLAVAETKRDEYRERAERAEGENVRRANAFQESNTEWCKMFDAERAKKLEYQDECADLRSKLETSELKLSVAREAIESLQGDRAKLTAAEKALAEVQRWAEAGNIESFMVLSDKITALVGEEWESL